MIDIVSEATRSRMMSGIRSKNTKPELAVRRYLHARGFRYRISPRNVPGRPDIVLPRYRAAILVHGCFWHRHPGCRLATNPASNVDFWKKKFSANVARDAKVLDLLTEAGWRAIVVWECEISDYRLAAVAEQIKSRDS